MARRRWDTAERLARKALAEAAGADGWAAGWHATVKAQAELAQSGAKGSTPAAAFVGRAAGLLRPAPTRDDGTPGVDTMTLTISGPGVAERLAALLARRDAGE